MPLTDEDLKTLEDKYFLYKKRTGEWIKLGTAVLTCLAAALFFLGVLRNDVKGAAIDAAQAEANTKATEVANEWLQKHGITPQQAEQVKDFANSLGDKQSVAAQIDRINTQGVQLSAEGVATMPDFSKKNDHFGIGWGRHRDMDGPYGLIPNEDSDNFWYSWVKIGSIHANGDPPAVNPRVVCSLNEIANSPDCTMSMSRLTVLARWIKRPNSNGETVKELWVVMRASGPKDKDNNERKPVIPSLAVHWMLFDKISTKWQWHVSQ